MRMAAVVIAAVLATAASPPGAPPDQPAQTPRATQAASSQSYAFPSGAGVLFFYVKPERTADFEAVVGRLVDVLDRTDDPARRQQAASWRIYKADVTRDAAIYLFVIDPAVAGADYDPVKLLSEGAPADVQRLYEQLKGATVRIERMGLTKLR